MQVPAAHHLWMKIGSLRETVEADLRARPPGLGDSRDPGAHGGAPLRPLVPSLPCFAWGAAVVDEALCLGCGLGVTECPAAAVALQTVREAGFIPA